MDEKVADYTFKSTTEAGPGIRDLEVSGITFACLQFVLFFTSSKPQA